MASFRRRIDIRTPDGNAVILPGQSDAPAAPARNTLSYSRKNNGSDKTRGNWRKKKTKTNSPSEEGPVLHFRNVLASISEADLVSLLMFCGTVVKVLMMRARNQALVEMESPAQARAVVARYASRPAKIRGTSVWIQHSSHPKLVELEGKGKEDVVVKGKRKGKGKGKKGGRKGGGGGGGGGGKKTVVLATIRNTRIQDVPADVVANAFASVLPPEKIVVFEKDGLVQALVQMPSSSAAEAAVEMLQGKSVLDPEREGVTTQDPVMEVQLSKKTDGLSLKVHNSHNKSYVSSTGASAAPTAPTTKEKEEDPKEASHPSQEALELGGASLEAEPGTMMLCNLESSRHTPDSLFNVFSSYGKVVDVSLYENGFASVTYADQSCVELALSHLEGVVLYGNAIEMAKTEGTWPGALLRGSSYADSQLNRFRAQSGNNAKHITPPSANVHISNLAYQLPEEELVDLITRVAGAEPLEVRVFKSRTKRQAIVVLPSVSAAVDVLASLHGALVHGRNIRVSFSSRE